MSNSIPYRFRKNLFDGVAHLIGKVLVELPFPVEIQPEPLTAETMARRLREAVTAKQKYGWRHPRIDDELFALHADKLSFSPQGDKVVAGERGKLAGKPAVQLHGRVPTGHLFTPENPRDLHTLLDLIDRRLFSPPLDIVTPKVNNPEELETQYEIGILPDETDPNLIRIIT